ncbi:hypothetical protein RchiOBHm_Chr5g0075971 [Rosa chinensis]|uniref:Uncharacterized protein n=1 Tax=Rosa chinensis TaxID=74649 RepID=A0A2P6QLK8_ROSCH|nr:hypothetical protein RchiOBHm_Chr5g0075971 [Rosa chinensis]
MTKHHPDLIMCRKQLGIVIGPLSQKCDGSLCYMWRSWDFLCLLLLIRSFCGKNYYVC